MPDVIAGRNPVLEALNAGRPINKVLVENNAHNGVVEEIIEKARGARIPVDFVDGHALDRLVPEARHQGVIAYAAAKDYVGLNDLLAVSKEKNETPLYLILDGIEDPQNFGAILRTAEAAGVHGVVVRSHRAVGLTPIVAKASAGAIEYVPVSRVPNIAQTIEALKKQGVWTVGIDMSGKTGYTAFDFKLPTAIVVGGEGSGLSDLVKKRCDVVASIPMKGKIGSLNASVAAAVVIYEAVKQRDAKTKTV
jgi:23S rRNA (guanosine2251-2'-O)-methyltransferase